MRARLWAHQHIGPACYPASSLLGTQEFQLPFLGDRPVPSEEGPLEGGSCGGSGGRACPVEGFPWRGGRDLFLVGRAALWLTTLIFPQGHSNGNRRYESDEDSLGSSGRVMRPEASLSWLRACLFQPLFLLSSCHCCLPRHLTHQLKEGFAKEPVPLANTF